MKLINIIYDILGDKLKLTMLKDIEWVVYLNQILRENLW